MRHQTVDQGTGDDVFDLPDEDRVSLNNHDKARNTFNAAGVDDYMATDKVLAGNGRSFFATRL